MVEAKFSSGHSFKPLFYLLGIIVVAFLGLAIFHVGGSPDINIQPAMSAIGKRTPVTVEVSESRRGLTHIRIELVQENKAVVLADKSYVPSSQLPFIGSKVGKDVIAVEAGRQRFPALVGGTATIRVTADRAGTWLRHPAAKIEELTLPVRLTPPSLQITSIQTYVSQGGCEAVTYKVGQTAVRDGVRAGALWFPGYPLPGGDARDRFAIFAVPYNMGEPNVRLVVEDAAGNAAEMGFIDKFFPKTMGADTIEVSDAFLNKVVPPILSQTPEIQERGTLLDSYLMINRELRRINSVTIQSLASKSTPAFLWTKPFLMMPNTKITAQFAERRTYMFQGRPIDQQDHLGFDLAQTKQAPIPAANAGVVVLAKFFGIYGNAVVIDHGFGMMTIYGHLSSIAVTEGQKVNRGDTIGKTGETGLAGGDHLHYCTLLHGLPVNPVEWSDGHWIKDRIAKKLGPGFAFVP
jgi:murein DD-endopeptidase MepM/ murein hydrolase activator NlpD